MQQWANDEYATKPAVLESWPPSSAVYSSWPKSMPPRKEAEMGRSQPRPIAEGSVGNNGKSSRIGSSKRVEAPHGPACIFSKAKAAS